MTLVQAWIDSLTLLKPKNLQLFAMVTLKSIVEAYKLMFKYFWWAWVLAIGCYVVLVWSPILSDSDYYVGFGFRWLYQLLLVAACLATRPSIAKKDCAYFRSYMYVFIYIAIYLAIVSIQMWPTAFSVWDIFLILFFADSAGGPKNFFLSMWYALKMIVFNYPLIAIMGICFYVPGYFFSPLINKGIIFFVSEESAMAHVFVIVHGVKNIIEMLLLPIGVCIYANIYIKKLHDQFDLYFKPVQ